MTLGGFGKATLHCVGQISLQTENLDISLCLDLEVISVMFAEQNEKSEEWFFGSLQTMGTAKGFWREPFIHPVTSLIHITQQK